MKDYSSLSKLGRDAGTEPIPIYLNTILSKYDEILYSIKEKQQQEKQDVNIKTNDDMVNRVSVSREEDIHELY